MTTFEMARKNYKRGTWTEDMLVKLVEKAKITVAEFKEITGNETVDPTDLTVIKEKALAALSQACEDTIVSGVDVVLADGTTEHFSLTATDQTNIDSMFAAVTLGATEYPYHADGAACKMYSAADIVSLYVAYKTLVTYQTTYYNMLKQYVGTLEDAKTIQAISYGDALPDEYQTTMADILTQANAQMQAILAKLNA